MLDKRLAAMSVVQRGKGSSINTITKSLQCIDNRISNSMVNKAIDSSADKLAFLADEIRENNKKSSYIMMDETTLPIDDKKGWVWVLIGDFGVQISIGPSRGKRFAEDIFGFYQGIPLVCDGYAVYNMFETIQRCWSHVLRHCKAAICDNETRRLYKKLQKLFAHAKKIQAKDQSQVTPELRQQVQKMIQKTLDIAQEYHKLDNKFGTHLENAAKDLYTFVTHPGMEPTNNASERMLRAIVIFRKICLRLMNEKSMKRFGDLFTCILTWERQGLDVYQKLLEVL